MNKLKYIIAISLLAFIGCKNGPEQVAKVDNCDEYSSNERNCNLASQKDDTKCYFSNNKCVAVPAPAGASGTCASLSSNQASCEMRFDCKFANNSCTATAADCTNVKNQTSCDNTYGAFCLWNTTASTCEKTTATAGAIYNWKKITLPAGTMDELTNFVVSKDNQHAYAYTTDAVAGVAPGLYHSADKGVTWNRFESAANADDGIVRGKVDPAAANCDYDSTAGAPIDLKPTQHGAVLIDDNSTGVWILEGATVKWAIKNGVNEDGTGTGAPTELADFAAQDIKFIDVVDINGVETITFAQADDAATEYMLWLKPTNNLQYNGLDHQPLRVQIKNAAGFALTRKQQWMRAGNTYDGDLLLASVIGDQTNKGTGIWEIAKANLPAADGTSPGTIGQLADNDRRLFPENGQPWAGDNGASNLDIQVIGSFANGADHEYFAGIKIGGANHQKGGLAHHKGTQTGAHASLETIRFTKSSVLSINRYGSKTVVITDNGIYGVGVNGEYNKADNINISAFAASKQDMMEATSDAVPFNPSHDDLLVNIFGDDDLSWYWLDSAGTNAETGIYLREKGTGQLRP